MSAMYTRSLRLDQMLRLPCGLRRSPAGRLSLGALAQLHKFAPVDVTQSRRTSCIANSPSRAGGSALLWRPLRFPIPGEMSIPLGSATGEVLTFGLPLLPQPLTWWCSVQTAATSLYVVGGDRSDSDLTPFLVSPPQHDSSDHPLP